MPSKARFLTPQEIKKVSRNLETLRDKTLCVTGLYAALRISEVIAIEQAQVFTASGGERNLLNLIRLKMKNTI